MNNNNNNLNGINANTNVQDSNNANANNNAANVILGSFIDEFMKLYFRLIALPDVLFLTDITGLSRRAPGGS